MPAELCPALFSPMASAHQAPLSARFQPRILKWAAMSFSEDFPDPESEPMSSSPLALAGGLFTIAHYLRLSYENTTGLLASTVDTYFL